MNATAGNATAGNATSGKATAAPASTTAAREMRPAPMMRQIAALARAEGQQLLRNKVALLNCFALPLIIGVICLGLGDAIPGGALATFFPIVVIGTARMVLTLAWVLTKNIWVSTGAHITNDWLLFSMSLLGAGLVGKA